MLETGRYTTISEIAKAEKINPSYVSRVLRTMEAISEQSAARGAYARASNNAHSHGLRGTAAPGRLELRSYWGAIRIACLFIPAKPSTESSSSWAHWFARVFVPRDDPVV